MMKLHVWAIANSMSTAIVTTFKSVWVVSFSVAASFDISESIIEMIWVSAWKFTTAISYNLNDFDQILKKGSKSVWFEDKELNAYLSKWFLSKTTITATGLMASAVQWSIKSSPSGVVKNIPFTFSISKIISFSCFK